MSIEITPSGVPAPKTNKLDVTRLVLGILVLLLLVLIAVPNFIKARPVASVNSCIVHLKAIDRAKTVWASENREPEGALPAEIDLIGPGKYIREEPICPAGGSYSLNPVGTKPTCTVPGHQL